MEIIYLKVSWCVCVCVDKDRDGGGRDMGEVKI